MQMQMLMQIQDADSVPMLDAVRLSKLQLTFRWMVVLPGFRVLTALSLFLSLFLSPISESGWSY
jgi:hypothetical protein